MTPPRPQAVFFEKKVFSETAQFRKISVQVSEKVYVTKQIETLPDWGGGAGSRSVLSQKMTIIICMFQSQLCDMCKCDGVSVWEHAGGGG